PARPVTSHTMSAQRSRNQETKRAVTVRAPDVPDVAPTCGDPLRGSASAVPDHSPTPRGPRESGRERLRQMVVQAGGGGKPSEHPSPQPPGFPKGFPPRPSSFAPPGPPEGPATRARTRWYMQSASLRNGNRCRASPARRGPLGQEAPRVG